MSVTAESASQVTCTLNPGKHYTGKYVDLADDNQNALGPGVTKNTLMQTKSEL